MEGLELQLKGLSEALETKNKAAIDAATKEINSKIDELKSKGISKEDFENVQKQVKETIEGFDALQSKFKLNFEKKEQSNLTLGEAISGAITEKFGNFDSFEKELKNTKVNLQIKAVGNMLLSSNLTGDSVATYNQRQAILPAQAVNFRDLMPTSRSATGLYVTYAQTGGEGGIATQTEGASKSQIDFDLSEVKTVNSYLAGFARFSKQMIKSLPFIETTLQRMLLTSFYKAENASFFSTVSGAATGTTTVTATDNVEQLIQLIANQKTANYQPSYVLVSETQMSRLVISTYNKGYYAGAGTVQITGQGLTIWGVPVLSASWVTDDKALIIDSNFLERVEVEGLNIQFSTEDADNFTKNLVTARIECYEAVNLMLPASAIYADFGNVS